MEGPGTHPADPAHPAPTAYEWLARLLVAVGAGTTSRAPVEARRSAWQCPAHDDASPSLSLGYGRDGDRAVIYCHAGCTAAAVLEALACPLRYLFTPPPVEPEAYAAAFSGGLTFPPLVLSSGTGTEGTLHEAFHPYGDRWRIERRRSLSGAKTITWETRDGSGAWIPGLRGATAGTLPLYRERDVVMGVALGEVVLVVESESSVDALRGFYATTWAGGASSPQVDTLARVLGDHDRVVVIADHDGPGLDCAMRIGDALPRAVVHVPELEGEDARDLHDRLGPDAFARLIAGATS